jgi:putative PIG3 family NAD(P)H quinone oxidoreductase
LIRVAACGLNRADILQRKGHYPAPSGASQIPGLEVCGVVEQVGRSVLELKKGQRVCALLEGGGYADYVSVAASQVLPVPSHWTDLEAAAVPEAFFTVWFNLFDKAHLEPSQMLLIHAGSSGVTTAAIAICNMLEIQTIVTTRSSEKVKFIKASGAKHVLVVDNHEFASQIKDMTDNRGVDVVLDMVGGSYLNENLHALSYGGRLVLLSFLQGAKTEVNLAPLLMKNLTIIGSTLRNQSRLIKADIAKALQKTIWPLLERNEYRPVIDRVFPFEEAMQAQLYMEQNRHIGKIVLQLS